MKKTISIFKSSFLALSLIAAVACESWIDVEPTDRLSEDKVYSTQKGFLQALNGVYAEMNNNTVYGGHLSVGVIDVLAQYYDGGSENSYTYYYYPRYDYTNTGVKNTFSNVWSKMYSLISSANIILEKCEQTDVLPSQYQKMIKGEALAMRAMFHLDLLRLFGPVMSENAHEMAIPYVTVADQNIQDFLTADVVIDRIIHDLTEASGLLQSSDPVLTDGVKHTPEAGDNIDFCYRQYRLNYFAVQVLLARAYLWKGDQTEALTISENAISKAESIFPFISSSAANGSYPDRVFSSEVIFALYNTNRINVYRKYFASTLDPRNILSFAGTLDSGRIPELYDSQNDLRYKMWSASSEGDNDLIFNKYEDVVLKDGSTNHYCYMMPLIRLSELYLIAAECETDFSKALTYLNTLRNKRNCPNVTPRNSEELLNNITSEFRKEMIGEGQMFFFYKRHAMQSIPNGSSTSGNMNMIMKNYVVPVPDSEIDNRL
ncbi:MAG: RagB/SusD family nutrient uptake outer membrane protein [Prevotella sp.]|nr:RagB/SusD family nutrient uptake outer membrane protein [Prevotella sp.]